MYDNPILIIDDEVSLSAALADFLEDYDYETLTAANGQLGMQALEEHTVEAVIVDLNMPVMDGYEFIARITEQAPDLPIIALSGVGLVEEAIKAFKLGAWDFISKPVTDMEIVIQTLDRNVEKSRLITQNKIYQNHLETLVKQRTQELENSRQQIIRCLGKAAEFKDNDTGMHVIRVGEICYALAAKFGLEKTRCETIRDAAPMHDIGKIGIQDEILLKPGKLNAEEWEHMKQHVQFGCEILTAHGPTTTTCHAVDNTNPTDLLSVAKLIALTHHEKWDGSGYPLGLSGESIPIEGRIVALADVYDALASERPYKKAFPQEKCLQILREGAGKHFDPKLVSLFLDNLSEFQKLIEKYKD
ncbi:MAG: HD-GYP domain-containing protein [Desulfovibrio sp.]